MSMRTIGAVAVVTLLALGACGSPDAGEKAAGETMDQASAAGGGPARDASFVPDPRPSGLVTHASGVAPGYVLFSPISSGTTYLLDRDAKVVHTWQSQYAPHATYLLDDGTLLRPGRDPQMQGFDVGGALGILQEHDWDGNLIWQWKLSDAQHILHHDVEPLPGGHLLAIGWEVKTPEQARAVGRRPDLIPEKGLWPDFVLEIEPLPPGDARIVWEWHVWDHLVQNVDPKLPNYGDPAEHPERLDINAGGPPLEISAEEREQLKALGYVPDAEDEQATRSDQSATADAGGDRADEKAEEKATEPEEPEQRSDYLHVNSVDYDAELDQILLTVPELGEVWILQRPRSTEEAAGPAGDFLYRWGNPADYGRGATSDKKLFYPHNAEWIPEGMADAGQILVFNNGNGRPEEEGKFSSLEQIAPPLGENGRYAIEPGKAWGPAGSVWSWHAEPKESFYAPFISGVQRHQNGNSFITGGPQGRMFEVNRDGVIVWDYWQPYLGDLTDAEGKRPWGLAGPLSYAVWRARKLAPDHPGLAGRNLEPLDPQPVIPPPAAKGPDPQKPTQ